MTNVNVTELRNHLPDYLKRVKSGEEVAVTSRGKVIARIIPEIDGSLEARRRLDAMRAESQIGDVVSPFDEDWEALRAHS